MNKNRLEAFSDGVFAIVITLLVLEIRIPEHSTLPVWGNLIELLPKISSFIFSFIIVGIYWVAHHSMLHYIQKVNRSTLWLNLLVLLCVSFLPFPTSVLGSHPFDATALWFYTMNLVAINLAGTLFWWQATKNPENVSDLSPHYRKTVIYIHSAPALVYMICAWLSSINFYATYSLFAVMVILFIFPVKQIWDRAKLNLK